MRFPALMIAAATAFCAISSTSSFAQSVASSYTTGLRYDSARQLVGKIAPDPDGSGALHFRATRTTYDPRGLVTKVENGELAAWQAETILPINWAGFTIFSSTNYAYDAAGRRISESTSSGGNIFGLTQYSYDANGRLECAAVRMNPAVFASLPASACTLGTQGSEGPDRIAKNVYDAAGQLVQIRKAVGTSLEQAYATYSYTPNGKQEYVIDANGNRAKLEYDGFDRQAKWIFPSTTLPTSYNPSTPANALSTAGSLNTADYEQYGYDANGNRTSLRKRDSSTLTYQFDALNRMTVKVVPERSGLGTTHTRDVYYTYDLRELMTGARFDSASGEGLTTAYDGLGRITSATQALDATTRILSYLYDKDGNRTRLTFPDGGYAGYAYDGLDRPQSVTANTADWTRSYVYDAAGTLASDTAGAAAATTFGRDGVGRLTSLGRDVAGGTSLDATTTFGYNPASQIVQEGRSNDVYAFTARANVSRPYTPNGLNQYTTAGSAAFCHDANGNLTADGAYVYLYDVENRLVEKRAQGGGNTNCSALSYAGALQAGLRYDPMGRLYETVGGATGTTRFLIDGDALVAEYDTSGTMLRRYVHGADGKADDPIAWYEGGAMTSGAFRFLYVNHQGSITLAADGAGGSARLFKFDEYGIPQSGDGASLIPANGARFLYTGQAWMPDLGMYYYKARIYSPSLGRFLQTDPIGYKDQVNLYAYVGNDPVDHVDPTGQNCVARPNGGQTCTYEMKHITVGAAIVTTAAAAVWNAAVNVYEHATGRDQAVPQATPSERSDNEGSGPFVYRGLSKTDVPVAGLWATNPLSAATPAQHVNGKIDTPFISTTKSFEVAQGKYGANGVVRIDLSKVTSQVVDVSGGITGASQRVNNYAIRDQEVLVRGYIPPQAMQSVP